MFYLCGMLDINKLRYDLLQPFLEIMDGVSTDNKINRLGNIIYKKNDNPIFFYNCYDKNFSIKYHVYRHILNAYKYDSAFHGLLEIDFIRLLIESAFKLK